MLSLSGVSVTLGQHPLFTDAALKLTPGRRVALVGGNGAGKTTLLEVVMGLRDPDEGKVTRTRGLRVGWLPQDVVDDVAASDTVLEHVLDGAAYVRGLEARMRALEARMADSAGISDDDQSQLLTEYSQVQDQFEKAGGWELESDAHRILAGLGFAPGDARRPTTELSGGWRVRVAMARLLIDRPDVLVLDEPTNHLDIETIRWLERFLTELPGALLFVSHDRDFIDAVADFIVELAAGTTTEYEVRTGTLAAEEGGFASFVAQREERLTQLRSARAQQDRQVAEVERFIERFRYKATKARQVQSRIRSLDRVERIEVPDDTQVRARFAFPAPARLPRVVVELSGVRAGYGSDVVLDDVDLVVERGRKVALLGPNGAGKSTLLRVLSGEIEPIRGSVTIGPNVEIAVVDQHQADVMDGERTVLEEFRTALTDAHRQANHRSMLGAFGFPGDLAERRVSELSGGERTRLGLAKSMATPVGLLLLDEPTNHLDLASRDVLEDAIRAYPGTVLLITHDRHVIRSAADMIIEVSDAGVRTFDGTWEELLERRERPRATVGANAAGARESSTSSSTAPARDRRREAESRNARHRATKDLRAEVRDIERSLAQAEQEVAELTRRLADPEVYADGESARTLVEQHGAAKDRASALFDAWERAGTALEAAEAGAEL
ncbi:MAG: ABC-F family ATP-binding cassette domain-containing protein [Nitriliruptoraceae bacterium]